MKLISGIALIALLAFTMQACSETKKRTPEQLAKEAFEYIKDSQFQKLMTMGITADEFMIAMEQTSPEFKAKDKNEKVKLIAEEIRHRQVTILEDAKTVYRQFCKSGTDWKNATYSTFFCQVETEESIEFSPILIEFIYNDRKEYIEIECVNTANGWKIYDDLSPYSFREANEEFIKKRAL